MFKFQNVLPTPKVEMTISNKTVVRVLLLIVVTFAGLAAVQKVSHAIVLILTAAFLALAFNAPVTWIGRRLPKQQRGSRIWATAISSVVLIVIISGFLASVVPPIARQSTTFINNTPRLINDFRDPDTPIGSFVERYNLGDQIDSLSKDLGDRLSQSTGTAVDAVTSVWSSIFSLLTVLVLTFMMIVEGPRWVALGRRLIPKPRRSEVDELTTRMYRVIKGYVNGQVTLAGIAAILMLPVLFLLNIPYPFALMFVVFVAGLIPMIGHTIGAIIVTLVGLTSSLASGLIVLAYYILYQQIENYVVQPRVQANTTDMSPLLVFIAVVVGVSFGGILGGLFAIPLMACARIAILYWLEKREISADASSA